MNFYVNTRIITGKDCIKNNKNIFSEYGKKALIVTSASAARKSGALDDLISALKANNTEYIVFDRITQNPNIADCFEAGKLAYAFKAGYIVGIGGGSPLDASKAVALIAANPEITEKEIYSLKWKNKPLPIIAVGTTAGTGSEVTGVAVITNSDGRKKSFKGDSLFPSVSFGDPKYTISLDDNFTRSTAVDALSHCVESYFNRRANDISKTFAAAGIKKIVKVFDKIIGAGTDSLDYDDRTELYYASLYGGLAISVTGTAFPHAVGYFLTEDYGVSHGTACAVFLPYFIKHNAHCVPGETEKFFDELGITQNDFINKINLVTPQIAVKLTENDIKSLGCRWSDNPSLKKNWGEVNPDFISDMLKNIFM